MPALGVGDHAVLAAGDHQAERHEEGVQQRGVVRVLEVLVVELPVAGQLVAVVAEDLQLPALEHHLEVLEDLRGKVLLDRLHVGGEGCEHHPVQRGHLELSQVVVRVAEVLRHAATLALHAALEGDALKVAGEVVRPVVVWADHFLRVAEMLAAELHAAVSAAVFKDVHGAVCIARHHHRRRADEGTLVVARVGDFGLERHEIPRAAVEDALDLALVDLRAGVDPVGDRGQAFGGPLELEPFLLPLFLGEVARLADDCVCAEHGRSCVPSKP